MEGSNGWDGGNMSVDVLDKTSVESWCIIQSKIGVHTMKWVALQKFGFVSDSQYRLRTVTYAASRVTRKHMDMCCYQYGISRNHRSFPYFIFSGLLATLVNLHFSHRVFGVESRLA
jgi:hypothetical protein